VAQSTKCPEAEGQYGNGVKHVRKVHGVQLAAQQAQGRRAGKKWRTHLRDASHLPLQPSLERSLPMGNRDRQRKEPKKPKKPKKPTPPALH
jgi:hypothetical protein